MMPLRYLYPECFKLLKGHDNAVPMLCFLTNHCPANKDCINKLAKRTNFLFEKVFDPKVDLLLAYYKVGNNQKTDLRFVVLFRDMREPRVCKANYLYFNKFLQDGDTAEWVIDYEYVLLGDKDLFEAS